MVWQSFTHKEASAMYGNVPWAENQKFSYLSLESEFWHFDVSGTVGTVAGSELSGQFLVEALYFSISISGTKISSENSSSELSKLPANYVRVLEGRLSTYYLAQGFSCSPSSHTYALLVN